MRLGYVYAIGFLLGAILNLVVFIIYGELILLFLSIVALAGAVINIYVTKRCREWREKL